MATDTAAPVRRTARRNYWQLPTFAIGVAAAMAAWTAFPPPPLSPADRFAHDLAALKKAIETRPLDRNTVEAVEDLAPRVAAGAGQSNTPTSALLAAGTAYLILAENAPHETGHWSSAAELFAKVDPAQLTDPVESKRFTYRWAKAQAALGKGTPQLLYIALTTPPPGEELEGERRRLLAEVALQIGPPDLRTAQDELTRYLDGPAKLPEETLASYRLRLGEIAASLNDVKRARSCARSIGETAPGETRAGASVLLARLAASESNWPEAALQYEAALATGKLPAEQVGSVHYQTGISHLQQRTPAAAVPHFEKAAAANGPVAAAAAVRLAELTLRDPALKGSRGKVIELLATAVKDQQPGVAFQNPFVSVNEVQAAFEEAVQVFLVEGAFAEAVRATEVYAAVAPPGRDREKRAEANAAWAAKLKENPSTAAEAAARFKAAAEDYAARAADYPTPDGRADLFKRAMTCFRQAGDEKSAATIIDRMTAAADLPAEAVAAAWVEKAEGLLTANQFESGVAALQKALSSSGPAAAIARVKLGMAHLARGQSLLRSGGANAETESKGMIEYGQRLLAQAATISGDTPAERESHQQALFELGKLLVQQGNIPEAEARFRKLVQAHPTAPLADQGRLYLGSCLLVSARGDHQGGLPPADADKKLAEAVELFTSLSGAKDAFLRTQADIRLANAVLLQKKYEELPALCDRLAARYAGKVQELVLLSMRYHAETFADRKADAARTLSRMQDVYRKLTDADFTGEIEEYTREYWRTQWFEPPGGRPKE